VVELVPNQFEEVLVIQHQVDFKGDAAERPIIVAVLFQPEGAWLSLEIV
jgi:hypothetical protein